VRTFDVIQPHQRLVVAAKSEVLTSERFIQRDDRLSPLDEYDYLMPTEYAPLTPAIVAFGRGICAPDSPAETAFNFMRAIYARLQYEKGATDVTTTADRVLELGRGVCQDFSHLMLATCRSQGIPARYVSGYLLSHGHDSATHAWVDVFLPEQGWISLDPTHNSEQGAHYVRIAVGRDYADVPPTRGVFVGNAKEEMMVMVKVHAL
jgi:transglutaminase-like putative cysteine protease